MLRKEVAQMPRPISAHRLIVISIITLLSITIAGAQSGRKSPRSAPLPPVPMPTPEPIAPVAKEKARPALTVVVGFDRMNYYGNAGMVDEAAALQIGRASCRERVEIE